MSCKIVAEIGINHNGSVDLAKKMIDQAVVAGCDVVKFQKRTIDLVYTEEELNKKRESPWGVTNREQKMGLEFGEKEYSMLDHYCRERGIEWSASPWDVESVKFLSRYSIPFIKIASATMCNEPVLAEIKKTAIPVVISTGMILEEELDAVVDYLGDQIEYVLSCTSTYPTKVEDINMSKMLYLKRKYEGRYKVGFSNHSPGITFILMAAALKAEMIEYHMTLDRSMYGSDQASSIELPGMLKIKSNIKDMEKAWGSEQIDCLDSEKPIRDKLMKIVKM